MKPFLAACAILFALWLALSGHGLWLLIALGAMSAVFAASLSMRGGEPPSAAPRFSGYHRLPKYLLWLAWQILIANIKIARIILAPTMPIAPQILRVSANQKSDAARALFANSITLTPGTVTLETERGAFLVHTLSAEAGGADALARMGDRVRAIEDAKDINNSGNKKNNSGDKKR